MNIRALRPSLVLVPARRPGWLEIGGRWPPVFCMLILLPLYVALHVLFAYQSISARAAVLVEILLLTLVMARSSAIRRRHLVPLTATLLSAEFLFFVGPARWIWPDASVSTLSALRLMGHPEVIFGTCGQIVLAVLLLGGLDPQLRSEIHRFVTPTGRSFVLRAAVAATLIGCSLWSGGRYLLNGGRLVEVRIEYVLRAVPLTYCLRPGPSTAPSTPASAAMTWCSAPASQYTSAPPR